ncbi:MAG: DNA-processing protein DprA [Pseudomonadales bacterium]
MAIAATAIRQTPLPGAQATAYPAQTMALTDTDFQFLAALHRYGRRHLRSLWQTLAAGQTLAASQTLAAAPAVFNPATRQLLADALQAQRLPWQVLRDQIQHHGVSVQFQPALPALLRQIPDAPLALYMKGQQQHLAASAIAMVGARRASHRALLWTEQTAAQLSALGQVIVSGMAFGIDAAAHRGALPSGRTIAVLGSGLDRPSPRSHGTLMAQILGAGGLVVSEYSLTQDARKHHFPERNRLVTGLARGVVVVEGGARSGSLISARLALEQGREVMAVPGPVGMPGSAGCHRLLKQGAALVENAADICGELGLEPVTIARGVSGPKDPIAARVFAATDATPTSMDQLAAATGLGSAQLVALLTRLELEGFVQLQADGYIRTP